MTTTVLLIRHAAHAHLGKTLSGRQANLPLSDLGLCQAAMLAERLLGEQRMGEQFTAVYASPVLRAQQTADAIAAAIGVPVETSAALEEIDFGAWTGMDFADLSGDPHWHTWNTHRATAQTPGGESMAAAQRRIVGHIEAAASAWRGQRVAMITHCDMIRAAIAHYLDLSLDRILHFDVDPASISRLAVANGYGRLITLNETAA